MPLFLIWDWLIYKNIHYVSTNRLPGRFEMCPIVCCLRLDKIKNNLKNITMCQDFIWSQKDGKYEKG